jgi:hypothetical protein
LSDCTDRLPKRGFVHLHLNRWLSTRMDHYPMEMDFAAMQRGAAVKENGEAAKE